MTHNTKDLNSLTKPELYEIAKKLNIAGRSRMTKPVLMEKILEAEAPKPKVPRKPLKAAAVQKATAKKISTPASHIEPAPSAPPAPPGEPVPYEGERGPELPEKYGMTVLRAMPRDPHWIFLYWEISDADQDRVRQEHGDWVFDRSQAIIKIINVSNGAEQQQLVLLDTGQWYLPVQADCEFVFEIGLVKPDGTYVVLARTKNIHTAPAGPSDRTDEAWMVVEEKFQELLSITGGFDFPASAPSSKRIRPAAGVAGVLRDVTHLPWSRFEASSGTLNKR